MFPNVLPRSSRKEATGWRPVSEHHTGAAVSQHAGKNASVQLVELHELQQICEAGLAFIHAEG